MRVLKRFSLQFLILAALLISSAASLGNAKAGKICCSACPAAVNYDIGLCYALQNMANECGIFWIQDPCQIQPAQVCIPKCTCDAGC
jgi:hypothetical protein